MHHSPSLGRQTSLRWCSRFVSVACTALTSVAAQGTPATVIPVAPTVPVVAPRTVPPTAPPDIPRLPNVVTAIPFHPDTGPEHYPWILLSAALDGHRGTFSLDTGSPILFLNADYLRARPAGGFDTVTTVDTRQRQQEVFVTVHTVRLGTLVQSIDATVTSPLPPRKSFSNAIMRRYSRNGLLGNLGWSGLEPFETIIDYVQQRVIFIRLDKAGHRLADVPAYTPAGTVRLLPSDHFSGFLPPGWGILARHGTVIDTLFVDTGAPTSDVSEGDQQQAVDQLKHVIAAHHTAGNIPDGVITVPGEKGNGDLNLLGAQFLSRLGVVGFNLRTHQLILYR